MLLYNINRPVEPPHNYNLKPFHNHHGNSPARSSFPGRAVSARHKCLFKKKSEKFKKSVDNYRAREYNIRVLATIAQLAEHLIRNERVVGSNPISGSKTLESNRLYGWVLFLYTNEPSLAENLCHLFPYGFSTLRLQGH